MMRGPAKLGIFLFGMALNAIAQSTWTPVESGTRLTMRSVTWTGNQLIGLCGQSSTTFYDTLLTSPDGITWTKRSTRGPLYGVTWMGDKFVAVGTFPSSVRVNQYRAFAMTSPDGAAWSIAAQDAGCNICTDFYDVVWTGTRLVAVGSPSEIAVSPDAKNWETVLGSGTSRIVGSVTEVVWTGTGLVAFGRQSKGGGFPGVDYYITTSPDGLTWTRLGEFTTIAPISVIWTGSQIAAVGGETLWLSKDGVTWTARRIAPGKNLISVVWTGNRYVALADGNPSTILSSQDGVKWTEKSLVNGLTDLAWTGKRLVVIGGSGQVLVSDEDPVYIPSPRDMRARFRMDPGALVSDIYTVSGRKISGPTGQTLTVTRK